MNTIQEKTCTHCLITKPLDAFRNDKYRPRGKSAKCRECLGNRGRELYPLRADKARAATAAWRVANLEKRQAYEHSHKEEKSIRRKVHYQENRMRTNAQNTARHAARHYERYYKTTEVITGVNDLSMEQILEIRIAYNSHCQYCGEQFLDGQLSIDHITPLGKGGANTLHNVVLACRRCNVKKHLGLPLNPVQPLLLTIALPKQPPGKEPHHV